MSVIAWFRQSLIGNFVNDLTCFCGLLSPEMASGIGIFEGNQA